MQKKKKTTNKHKESKTKAKHKHKKNILNLIPIHLSNPLSSPYQALIKHLFRPYRNLF